MTTPLLLLRCVQLGIHISELDLLTIGTVNDMYTEMNNDENREAYSTLASQEDMDAFEQKGMTRFMAIPFCSKVLCSFSLNRGCFQRRFFRIWRTYYFPV